MGLEVSDASSAVSSESKNQGKIIAFFLPSLAFGGVERVMLNLMVGLLDCGYVIHLLLADCSGDYLTQVDKRISVIDLKSPHVARSLFPLVRYLRDVRPAVLMTGKNYSSIIALAARIISLSHTKVLVTVHSMMSFESKLPGFYRQKLIPILMRYTFPFADYIVAVSEAVAEDLASFLKMPLSKINVIYNPAIMPTFAQLVKEPVTHPWLAQKTLPVVVAAGRLVKEKNFDQLIRVFAMVRRAVESRLIILGEGPERRNLVSLINELELAEFVALPGYVDNVPAYIAHSDVFALTSLWESLPTVAIEALAADVPVVAVKCTGGISEILKDGLYGKLVTVGDDRQLADAIVETLNSTTPSFSDEACERFTLAASVSNYARLIEQE